MCMLRIAGSLLMLMLTALPAAGQTFSTVCSRRDAPVLGVRDSAFVVDGQPKFPVLISYLDAMRASPAALESDFAFLRSKGIDGVRIFPLWIRDAGTPTAQKAEATLLDSDGKIRSPERWQVFTAILNKAA